MDTIECKALCAFTRFVSGYGQVHGNPDAKDAKVVKVPVGEVQSFIDHELVAAPKGWTDPASDTVEAAPSEQAPAS